jgi:mRNA-degrading endonuclease RelE of RelBE toxin-antitoxin system
MSFEVIATDPFERKLKKLAKKYKSLGADLAILFEELEENPTLGVSIGKDCYKIRVHITSKGKGKSGGARLITYVRVVKNTIFLMDIYDKSEQATISAKELKMLIDILDEDS